MWVKKPDLTQLWKKYQLKSSEQGIDGFLNFARKGLSYIQAGHEMEQNSQRFEQLHFDGFVYRPCVVAHQNIRSNTVQTILLGLCTQAIFLLVILLQSELTDRCL